MRCNGSHLLLAFLVLLTAMKSAVPQITEEVVTAYIEGDGRAVIAFLPPSMQDSKVRGASDAKERVGSAIDSLRRCIGEDHVSYQVVFAERIVVRSVGREETFELGHHALVGALLLRPGSNARILFAGGGPEALATMLVPAATEYFEEKCKAG